MENGAEGVMSEAKKLMIADLQIAGVSETELDTAFKAVVTEHRHVIESIGRSMAEADSVYRKYLEPDYEPVETVAKSDRAALNKAEKNIAENYASLVKAYEKPLEQLGINIKTIRNAIKSAAEDVDSTVKRYEKAQKTRKMEAIQKYFNTTGFTLVPLDKIFDRIWLNKTVKLSDIRKEIDSATAAIYQNIKLLENIPDHGMMAKALYLENLDMAAAMRQVENLKANAERLIREKKEREDRERAEQVERNREETRREEREAPSDDKAAGLAQEAMNDFEEPEEQRPRDSRIIGFTCRFWGTEKKLRELRKWMTDNGIAYEKVDTASAAKNTAGGGK
jgi:hypothetical protein